MTIVDSSGWLQYLFDGPLAGEYEAHLGAEDLAVPAIVAYEVYKAAKRRLADAEVTVVAARLANAQIVPLDCDLAFVAAALSIAHGLPMADAIIYATAQTLGAILFTSDKHFAELAGVVYLPPPG